MIVNLIINSFCFVNSISLNSNVGFQLFVGGIFVYYYIGVTLTVLGLID